ncbi:unnamed protein product, partial [Effrenium voratum]
HVPQLPDMVRLWSWITNPVSFKTMSSLSLTEEVVQALATMFTDITGAPDAQGFQDTLKKVRSVAVDGAAAMAK